METPDPSLAWTPLELPDDDVHPLLNRLRAALVAVVLVLFTLPCMALVALGVSPDWVVTRPMRWWALVELWLLDLEVQLEGAENLPPGGAFIAMANHQSALDVFVFASCFARPTFYVVKTEMGRIPFLGWFLRQTDQVFLDRRNRIKAIESLSRGVEKLRAGMITVIFPEGTRTAPGTLGPFKKGAFHLAVQAKVPVVPITVLNSGLLLSPRSVEFRPGVIRVVVGKPIDTTGWTDETLEEHVALVRRAIAAPLGEYRESLAAPLREQESATSRGAVPASDRPADLPARG